MVPTDADRAPNLDDILARLAALAPMDTDTGDAGDEERSGAPLPETASTLREPILDLTRIAEATEQLAPAGVTLESAVAGAAGPLDYAAEPEAAPRREEPIIDLTDREAAAGVVAEPEVTEPPVDDLDASMETLVEEAPADTQVQPVAASGAGDLIDIRRPEGGDTAPAATIRKTPGTRTRNPFRRLILWSVALGLVLLVVAGVVILT